MTLTAAKLEAHHLIAATTVPKDAVALWHAPRMLQTGPASFCVPFATESRYWRIPNTTMAAVIAYFDSHPTPGLAVQGHGTGGTGDVVTSRSLQEAASLDLNPSIEVLAEPGSGGSVMLQVQALVVPAGADCPHTDFARPLATPVP